MINLVVALPAEAHPIIRHFALKRLQPSETFPVFAGETVRLIRSGPGKNVAYTAVEQLRTHFPEPHAWLNFGIAGHAYHPLGTPLLANKVVDRESGQTWVPIFPFPLPCDTAELITVDRPEETYAAPCAYDMEASGFFAAARSAVRADRVHSLKIVSDNPQSGHCRISSKRVEELVEQNLRWVEQLIIALDD